MPEALPCGPISDVWCAGARWASQSGPGVPGGLGRVGPSHPDVSDGHSPHPTAHPCLRTAHSWPLPLTGCLGERGPRYSCPQREREGFVSLRLLLKKEGATIFGQPRRRWAPGFLQGTVKQGQGLPHPTDSHSEES